MEIVPLLKKNFLTKNLNDNEIEKLAGAMKPLKFLKKEIIIKYGDIGSTYYILSKGSVKVTVYQPGTQANSPDLENKKLFTKYMG
jgi:CRP-like cAMP-binding protein